MVLSVTSLESSRRLGDAHLRGPTGGLSIEYVSTLIRSTGFGKTNLGIRDILELPDVRIGVIVVPNESAGPGLDNQVGISLVTIGGRARRQQGGNCEGKG